MANPKTPSRSLASLLIAQAQVVFNDNAAKIMLIALVQFPGVLKGIDADVVKGVVAALLVAPLVAFAPLALDGCVSTSVTPSQAGLMYGSSSTSPDRR